MRMIILAAGQGTRLRPLTDNRPKCLVELGGRPLIDWQIEAARRAGVTDVIVVGGYKADLISRPGIRVVLNPQFETTNMVTSLFCAEEWFENEMIVSYGDIVYGPEILRLLLNDRNPASVVVDREWLSYWRMRFDDPMKDAESLRMRSDGNIGSIGQIETDISRIDAQYIGLMIFRREGVAALIQAYAVAKYAESRGQAPFGGKRSLSALFMTDLLQGMVDLGYALHAISISGGWVEIDSLSDLDLAQSLLLKGRLSGLDWL